MRKNVIGIVFFLICSCFVSWLEGYFQSSGGCFVNFLLGRWPPIGLEALYNEHKQPSQECLTARGVLGLMGSSMVLVVIVISIYYVFLGNKTKESKP